MLAYHLLAILFCVAPAIHKGIVVFASGNTLTFLTSPKLLRSLDEAQEKGLPVAIRDEVTIIHSWCRVLKTNVKIGYEDEVRSIQFFDFYGTRLGASPQFYGVAHVLERTKRVLLDGDTSHFLNYDSIIINENGRVVARLKRPGTSLLAVGHSDDQQVLWLATKLMKHGRPYAHVLFVTCNGVTIAERTMTGAGTVTLQHERKFYVFKIPPPAYPE
jgi:hypothetical protein